MYIGFYLLESSYPDYIMESGPSEGRKGEMEGRKLVQNGYPQLVSAYLKVVYPQVPS